MDRGKAAVPRVKRHVILCHVVLNAIHGRLRRASIQLFGVVFQRFGYACWPSDGIVARVEKGYCIAVENGAARINAVRHGGGAGGVQADVIAVYYISAAARDDYSAAAAIVAVA